MTRAARRSRDATIRQEAQRIVDEELARLRMEPYEALMRYREPDHKMVIGPTTGIEHGMEIQAIFDSGRRKDPGGDLRVMVTVWKNIRPWASSDFIISKDGTFVGE